VTAPLYVVAACLAAVSVAVLHLVVLREPPGEQLPTARFVPAGSSIVRVLAATPTDRLLLAVRMAAVLLVGLAFGRPRVPHPRVALLSIVAVDRSSAVYDEREVVDSARLLVGSSTRETIRSPTQRAVVLIVFDSAAAVMADQAVDDTLHHLRQSSARGSLTATFVSALRVAAAWRDRTDSLELLIVSPARGDEVDAALAPVRALWPGGVRLVRVSAQPSPRQPLGGLPTVDWPADGHTPDATARATIDTVGALVVGDLVAVRPFERRWQPDTDGARVIGRWTDGAAAIVERRTQTGCAREVGVAMDTARDQTEHPEMARLVRALHAPCRAPIGAEMKRLRGDLWLASGGGHHIPATAFGPPADETNRLPVILLALALVALLAELVLRSRRRAAGAA